MTQDGENSPIIFSVSEYIEFVNITLAQGRVVIRGEIGKIDDRGKYVFFSLHDQNGDDVISCFVWGYVMAKLGFTIQTGQTIDVLGYGRVYGKRGTFSVEVQQLLIHGEGVLSRAFEELKLKLEKEGLFDPRHKRAIPKYCQKIGLVTSAHGQALHDFVTHLGDCGVEIYLVHSSVEGIYAIDEIVEGIKQLNNRLHDLDVIVLTRGGGSSESLQAFNSEAVARAIRGSKTPIISAIGHTKDMLISDLAADLRCNTPTNVGEVLGRPWHQARHEIFQMTKLLSLRFDNYVEMLGQKCRSGLREMMSHESTLIEGSKNEAEKKDLALAQVWQFWLLKINGKINLQVRQKSYVGNAIKQGKFVFKLKKQKYLSNLKIIEEHKKEFANRQQLLLALSPKKPLLRGFGLVRNEEGKIIKSVKQLTKGKNITIELRDGIGLAQTVES